MSGPGWLKRATIVDDVDVPEGGEAPPPGWARRARVVEDAPAPSPAPDIEELPEGGLSGMAQQARWEASTPEELRNQQVREYVLDKFRSGQALSDEDKRMAEKAKGVYVLDPIHIQGDAPKPEPRPEKDPVGLLPDVSVEGDRGAVWRIPEWAQKLGHHALTPIEAAMGEPFDLSTFSPGAAGVGALDALSLGWADEAAGAIGGDAAQSRMRMASDVSREHDPVAYHGGSAAAALGTAAVTPSAAVGAAGLAGKAGLGGLGKFAAGTAGAAAEGAALGAAAGAGFSDAEDSEEMLEAAGEGALLGGALGGGMRAAPDVIKTAVRAPGYVGGLGARLYNKVAGEMPDEVVERAIRPHYRDPAVKPPKGAPQAAPRAEGVPPPMPTSPEPAPLAGREMRDAAARWTAHGEEASGKVTEDLTRLEQLTDFVMEKSGPKASSVRKAMEQAPPNVDRTYAEAASTAQDVQARLETLAQDMGNMGAAPVKRALREVESFLEGMDADPVRQFMRLDGLKRSLGKLTKRAQDPLARQEMQNSYEVLRRHLEDAEVWGEGAAQMQREVNKAWSSFLRSDSRFGREFLTDVGDASAGGWDTIDRAEGRKIQQFLEHVHEPGAATPRLAMERGLQGRQSLVKSLGEHYGDTPAVAGAAQEALGLSSELQEFVQRTAQDRRAAAEIAQLPGAAPAKGFYDFAKKFISPGGAVRAARLGDHTFGNLKDALQRNPELFGKYAPALTEAARQGGTVLSVKHFVLSQQDPEYRRLLAEMGEDDEEGGEIDY
jgi:hypothetical protein